MHSATSCLRTSLVAVQVALLLLAGASSVGCSKAKTAKPANKGKTTVEEPADRAATFRVLCSEGYLDQQMADLFESKTGTRVVIETFEGEEQFKEKWADGEGGFSIVIAQETNLFALFKAHQLLPLDRTQIPNWKNLDPKLLGPPYDRDNKFAVPMFYGPRFALAVRTDYVPNPGKGLDALFEEKHKNRIVLPDDAEGMAGMLALHLGIPVNAQEPADLEKLRQELLKLKPLVRAYDSAKLQEKLIEAEAWVVLGDRYVLSELKDRKNLRIVIPESGTLLWVDHLVVAKNTKFAKQAHEFIHFLLDPEVAQQSPAAITTAVPNTALRTKLEAVVTQDPFIYPPAPPKVKQLSDWMLDSRPDFDTKKIQEMWKEIKGEK